MIFHRVANVGVPRGTAVATDVPRRKGMSFGMSPHCTKKPQALLCLLRRSGFYLLLLTGIQRCHCTLNELDYFTLNLCNIRSGGIHTFQQHRQFRRGGIWIGHTTLRHGEITVQVSTRKICTQ